MESDGEVLVVHRGGCHCGRVRFEVDAPAELDVSECSCSICRMVGGFQHLIVSRARFRLLSGADALSTYTFNTGTARHTFCSVCGIKSFYTPRSHPEGVSVSARCLEPETVRAVRVTPFDGANWEAHREELAALSPLSPGGGPEAGHGR